jgi:hypothetical protein
MPIKDASGDVVGVAQVINKLGGEQCFSANDEKVRFFLSLLCGNYFPKSTLEVIKATRSA